jgi:hypothetical protein
MLRLIG